MTERERQSYFAQMVPLLLQYATLLGYEYTLGDAYRDPRAHGEYGQKGPYGSANSYHKRKLAIDVNLFKNGVYLTETKDHERLGVFWEILGGTWGGRFSDPDGNHYSYGESR